MWCRHCWVLMAVLALLQAQPCKYPVASEAALLSVAFGYPDSAGRRCLTAQCSSAKFVGLHGQQVACSNAAIKPDWIKCAYLPELAHAAIGMPPIGGICQLRHQRRQKRHVGHIFFHVFALRP